MEKKVRRSQLIQPFGVGSIVDINGEGFIVKDINHWHGQPANPLILDRLQKMLGGKQLKSFSDNPGQNEKAVVKRFPQWYHCPSCGHLESISFQHDRQTAGATPTCGNPQCKQQPLSPMRFVAYCDNGHLTDINWHRWCHKGSSEAKSGYCADYHQLYFRSTGKSGGDFDQMIIECKACDVVNTLADITRGSASRDVVWGKDQNCCGSQPWYTQKDDPEPCDQRMRIEPRGSSSVYRGKVVSALDIAAAVQPEEDDTDITLDHQFKRNLRRIKEQNKGATPLAISEVQDDDGDYATSIDHLAEDLEVERDIVVAALVKELQVSSAGASDIIDNNQDDGDIQQELLLEEMELFRRRVDINSNHLSIRFFKTKESGKDTLSKLFSAIGQVKKLREIRALTGFTRGKGLRVVPVDSSGIQGWVPAVEAFGEGIYFELNMETIRDYFAAHGEVLDVLVKPQQEALERLKDSYPVDIPASPLFILTHTLSHLLIRQLTFNSGYSSSALRERLFAADDNDYAGILIYTSDSDAEGTMGGLVDQARLERLESVVEQCVESAFWCSSDPVCRETENQGFAGLNRSACHCCSLVSETSCMYQNAMLNRLTLGGLGEDRNEAVGLLTYIKGLV